MTAERLQLQLVAHSNRLPGSFCQNEFAGLIEGKRRSGAPLLDLTCSNPTLALAAYPHPEIARALGSIGNFSYRPDPFGALSARKAVSRHIGAPPDRIALTASTSEAYSILFKLLCDPGHEVLVPVPSYPLFEYLAALECVRTVPYPLDYDGAWHIDFEALESRITPATRAIITVNPNNPTGSFVKTSEALRLFEIACARRLPIIADEVFSEYRWTSGDIVPTFIGFDSQISFSLGGLSKSAAMPQMKLGWIVCNGPPSEFDSLHARLELILDTYLSVNTPVQAALPAILDIGNSLRAQVNTLAATNLPAAMECFASTPVHCLNTEGGWSLILQLPRVNNEQKWITAFLEQQSVIVQPGYFFDMPSEPYIVISLITPAEIFTSGVERIRDVVTSECR